MWRVSHLQNAKTCFNNCGCIMVMVVAALVFSACLISVLIAGIMMGGLFSKVGCAALGGKRIHLGNPPQGQTRWRMVGFDVRLWVRLRGFSRRPFSSLEAMQCWPLRSAVGSCAEARCREPPPQSGFLFGSFCSM